MADFDLRSANLRRLNSLTKYPSIPTYHSLDPANGGLLPETVEFSGPVIGTEKVDGTNARIISLPDGSYLLGSREELLYAQGDLIGNPALGIVDALRPLADTLPPVDGDTIQVRFLEVYGGKVTGASKNYTGNRTVGFRMFDIAVFPDYRSKLDLDPAAMSNWRESGGQQYLSEDELVAAATADGVEMTPRLFAIDAAELPSGIEQTNEFLSERMPVTLCRLDDGAAGDAEGIVLRSKDRAVIAKARFQDYRRTLRRKK
jgi:hypothetical protein